MSSQLEIIDVAWRLAVCGITKLAEHSRQNVAQAEQNTEATWFTLCFLPFYITTRPAVVTSWAFACYYGAQGMFADMAPFHVPFPESFALDQAQILPPASLSITPQPQTAGPRRRKKSVDHLPGLPNIPLHQHMVLKNMHEELITPVLDELYSHLWMLALRSYSNIDPLHQQALKGRKLLLSEDAKLHLLWHDDKIYIKPVPTWLLNYQVWHQFLHPTPQQTAGSPINQQRKGQAFLSTPSEPVARRRL